MDKPMWSSHTIKFHPFPQRKEILTYSYNMNKSSGHSVQFSHSVMSDSLWPHELQHARLPCPSSTPGVYSNSSIELVMPSNHLILCHPLLLLPSIFPSIRVFSSESVLHIRWLKYWSFSFSISPSNEYSGLISFRIDSQESSPMPQFKSINFFLGAQLSL